jgi:hypothetical protein
MYPSRASVRTSSDPVTDGEPPAFDPGVAHPARVYNYWLGGKDHYLADRVVAGEVARRRPHVVAGARANRAFLARAVEYLAGNCGIRQFLDIGTGLPAPGSTHELAQQVAPECAVAYADNDPLVLVYARALLTSRPEGRCGYMTADFAPDQVGAAVEAYRTGVPGGVTARSHAQVTALFGGLPMVPPGVVPVAQWRPAVPVSPTALDADLYAGIARISPHAYASATRLGVLIG